MTDSTRSLVVQDGVIAEGGAGFFSGVDSPTFDAPVGSLYLKTDTTRFVKILPGAGGENWQQEISLQQDISWQILGRTQLTVAANATSILTIPPRTLLRLTAIVTGYSGNGIASFRFGGTAGAVDSGNNYNTRFIRMNAGSKNNFTDAPQTSTSYLRMASRNRVLGRQYVANVTNFTTKRKMVSIDTATEAGGAGTAADIDVGQGMWANTTQQIISVQLISTANNLSIGSGFIVEGMNLV